MIIPVKCFTCGNVLGDKYEYYCKEVRKRKIAARGANYVNEIMYFTTSEDGKTPEGTVLDEMGLTRMCCRRSILTHVDID